MTPNTPKYRPTNPRKHPLLLALSLLSLLLLTAALPALGDLNYLKRNYTYREKVPIKSVTATTNSGEINKLLDNQNNTEWISWNENVIWTEDYSEPRYFTTVAIDGANNTTSTIDNNTLTIQEIPGNSETNQTSRIWRQYQLFNSTENSELQNLKQGTYKLKLRYKGSIAAANGLRLYLGNGDGSVGNYKDVDVSTDWAEKEVTFELPGNVEIGAVCCVQPGFYAGIIEVDWAELSYVQSRVDYNTLEPDYRLYGADSGNVTFENDCLVATHYSGWYQFPCTPDLSLKPNTTYNVTFNIKGENERSGVNWWVGQKNSFAEYSSGSTLNYATEFKEQSIQFTTNESANPNDPGVIKIQPAYMAGNEDKIQIKSIKIEEVGGATITLDYSSDEFQKKNWPYQSGTDYIPVLFNSGNGTVARITYPEDDKYAFRLAHNIPIPNGTYNLKVKIKAEGSGNIHMMVGTGSSDVVKSFHFNLDPESDTYTEEAIKLDKDLPYWVVCQPSSGINDGHNGDYTGNFTVEYIEFEDPTEASKNWPIINYINNENSVYGEEANYWAVKDGIVYSYPLPQSRMVIVADGNAKNLEERNGGSEQTFSLQANRMYNVSYKIKGTAAGKVITRFTDRSGNNLGQSQEFDIPTSDFVEINTNITTTSAADKAGVVLDLGYYLGGLEIKDLKIVDYTNNGTSIGNQASTSAQIAVQGETSSPNDKNFVTQQFYAATDLNIDKTKDYKINVTQKASETGQVFVKLGDFWDNSNRVTAVLNFSKNDSWNTLTHKWDDLDSFDPMYKGSLTLQLRGSNGNNERYNGNINIKYVSLNSYKKGENWKDGKISNWTIPNHSEFPYYVMGKCKPEIKKENEETILIATPTPGEFYQFFVGEGTDFEFKQGKIYKLKATIKGAAATSGARNVIDVLVGTWNGLDAITSFDISTDWQDIDVTLPPMPVNDGFVLFQPKNDGEVQIKNLRVVENANETVEVFRCYVGNNPSQPIATGLNIFDEAKSYDRFELSSSNGLTLKPYGLPTTILEIAENDANKLDIHKTYRANFNLNVSHAGNYKITLGNEEFSQEVTRYANAGDNAISVEFSGTAAETGKLTITPLGYTQTLTVTNATLSAVTPAINEGSINGTDYFEVELGTPLHKDGKYSFHFGYSVDGANKPMPQTPTQIIVQGEVNGTFKNLGQYDLTPDVSDADRKGNMFIDTYANPLKHIDNNTITRLRILCSDNQNKFTGAVKEGENNYTIGSMMRLTRFGVYKLTDFCNTTTAQNDNWVVPVITRFQIEAMGQRYAYPGPRLRDMIGLGKYVDNAGQLFDGDPKQDNKGRTSYWDTTLPYNKEFQRTKTTEIKDDDGNVASSTTEVVSTALIASEGAQNRDYQADGIVDAAGKVLQPNDYIDIILPQFTNKVLKYNGTQDNTNGKNQVVIVLKRGKGNINTDDYANVTNNLIKYDGLDDDPFLNKGNGFPLEIKYKGITRDIAQSTNGLSPISINTSSIKDDLETLRLPWVAEGDSVAFALDFDPAWAGIRLYCMENTGNTERRYGKKSVEIAYRPSQYSGDRDFETISETTTMPGTRIFRVSELRAYMELPKVNLDNQTSRNDFAKLYNNRENFNTYGWVHTQGIIDDINNAVFDAPVKGTEKYMKTANVGGDVKTWQDVINKYKYYFDSQKLSYPDFSFLEDPFNDDNDVVPSFTGPKYTGFGQRQRTYTVLHEVYALPGERIDLHPYSDMWNNDTGFNYEDQFVRWYDYLTDEAPSYLYFFSDPKSVIKTDMGFIGGKTLLDHGYRGRGSVASIFFNENIYTDKNHEDHNKYYFNDGVKDRMIDQWVAADFSLTFNTNLAERLGKDANYNNKSGSARNITEPIVTFRHLFHIQSASVFADNNMADHEGNAEFAKSNRRYISTFANKTFKIRLEEAMPVSSDTKSAYYYKYAENDYRHIRGYEIKAYPYDTYNPDDYKIGLNNIDYKAIKRKKEISEGVFEYTDKDMFGPDDEIFMRPNSDVETNVNEEKWIQDFREFARSIKCHKLDADKGKYIVRIYGKNKDGEIIQLKSRDKDEYWPLVIAEYEVEFLDDKQASFVADQEIPAINRNPNHDYYSHMEKYLDSHYGKTAKVHTVNFDQYTILKKDNVKVPIYDANGNVTKDEKGNIKTEEANFYQYGFFENRDWAEIKANRLKLPIKWDDSNYGFGYTTSGDYNMFRLADHSVMTPYKHAAEAKKDNPYDAEYKTTQTGTYDRLFYNSGGKEKGLFYYVNAASDPGEMVRIDFDYLCPGSTIYVSAWVNEFNDGQPETANVIFNFYGNVAKTNSTSTQGLTREGEESGTSTSQKILRTEQLHGFATGYVKRNPQDDYENGIEEGGDQGKWMHVFYTFMPDKSRANLKDDEEIVSYSLVLENNSVSSKGADYAIDDVRAYVVAPQVYAEQKGALCQKDDVDIEIQVQLPLEALIKSIANQGEGTNDVIKLQYSIVDKTKYDDKLEEIKIEKGDDYIFSTDDYYAAFAAGVLHYPHDNIEGATGVNEKPTSWGTIDFYPNYKAQSNTQISGSTQTIGQYMNEHIETIEGVDCFTFITTPVALSSDGSEKFNEFKKTHHNYYIVVDNLGVNSIFTDVKGEDGNKIVYDEGQTNADVYPEIANKAKWPDYDKELAKAYQWCSNSNCDRKAEFSLKGAAQIVVDGMLYDGGDEITCCENQRPVVQINLKNKLKTKNETSGEYELSTDMSMVDNDATINPYLDWYVGPFEDFAAEHKMITVMKDGSQVQQDTDLWDVLDAFREDYPKSDTWNVPVVGQKDDKGNDLPTGEVDSNGNPKLPRKYTSDMRDWLKELAATSKIENGTETEIEPKLFLHQSSFIFPQSQTKLDKDEWSKEIFATAIPTVYPEEIKLSGDKTYVICTQPKEVKITVTNTSPEMFNGFNGMTYPASIEDVPLRVGLKDLDRVAKESNTLFVPLRKPVPATDDVTDFQVIPDKTANDKTVVNNYVYLVETNDPHYRQISDFVDTETKPATPAPTEGSEGTETSDNSEGNADKKKDDIYVVDTRIAGKVANIVAKFEKGQNGEVTVSGTPMAQIKFFDDEVSTSGNKFKQGITFREGYYYKFKFNFEEAESPSMTAAGYEEKCQGQTVFSIKVVPEYQQWTGNASLNWNNDENWTRVSKTQLLADSETPSSLSSGASSDTRFTTTGSNSNTFSYAPLDFTKVIIPAGSTYPQLAARRHSNATAGAASDATTVSVDNGKESASYVWEKASDTDPNSNAPKAAKAAGNGTDKESVAVGASASVSYHPTLNIQYDMAAVTYTGNNNVYCRPWYANACDQIHFNSNAEILNQQHLDYQKAWVDMEMTPHRWYTVASPLYGVVAGDMYLPTDLSKKTSSSAPSDSSDSSDSSDPSDQSDQSNSYYEAGRQMTELFTDITYNSDVNDRFAPAVYQRGWDKGSETVYTVHGTSTAEKETVALASTWSHVYNDVTEEYAPGVGYSVKTDVTRLSNFQDNASAATKQTYVKFRFPKADESYNYFEDGNSSPGEANHRNLTRTNAGKLYNFETPSGKNAGDVVLSKANSGKLFLVGNPFMAHLDMKEFFNGNSNIENKFWIMSENQQLTGIFDEKGDLIFNGTVSPNGDKYEEDGTETVKPDYRYLAPMQGFFVQAIDGKTVTDSDGNTTLSITFTPNMMAVQSYDAETNTAPILKAPAHPDNAKRKTQNAQRIIRLSTEESTAIIRLNDSADKGYAASEDVEMIDDSNQQGIRRIYTVAGTMASAINQTPDADGVEVGLMAPMDSVTTVTFNGLALEDYLLYDMQTGEMTQLYDGFSMEMEGAVSGRYFLTSGLDTAEIEDGTIRIEPQGDEIVVTAPAACGSLTVRVFDTLGREVAMAEGFDLETRIRLTPGIYVVDARGTDRGRHTAKLSLR